MSASTGTLAQITIVRVLTPAGPYVPGDVLSVAFTVPEIGRLRCHDGRSVDSPCSSRIVPDALSAVVLCDAEPYAAGQNVTLAFVDPSIARIHPGDVAPAPTPMETVTATATAALTSEPRAGSLPGTAPPLVPHEPSMLLREPRAAEMAEAASFDLRLRWSSDRVRRFVQVCDKLFTVERLGWYRHSLVVRLLVPDRVRCADALVQAEAAHQLDALRAAVADTLGNPLLAVFMPNFSVTPGWLETVETSDLARTLAAFRGVVAPHLPEVATADASPAESVEETIGTPTRSELLATPFSAIEAALALLVPHASPVPALSDALGAYRTKLAELFAQMAETPERTRLRQMTQANHVLDDQLWQLVSAVQLTFEPVPAA